MRRLVLLPLLFRLLGDASPKSSLLVSLDGVRNSRGFIQACLIATPSAFPNCERDPRAIRMKVPATVREVRFDGVEAGQYALVLFHDENANNRLDTILGIPREGFGFSRNPAVHFGAPKFDEASITIRGPITRLHIRLQYLL